VSGRARDAAFAAVDLGASGGRVMVGCRRPGPGGARRGRPVRQRRSLAAGRLERQPALGRPAAVAPRHAGLRAASTASPRSPGRRRSPGWPSTRGASTTDSSTRTGACSAIPTHYRDRRTEGGRRARRRRAARGRGVPASTACSTCRSPPSNQLAAEPPGTAVGPRRAAAAAAGPVRLLAVRPRGHRTDQRLDDRAARRHHPRLVAGRCWTPPGSRRGLLAPLHAPGAVLGELRPRVAAETGLPSGVTLTAVGSHDTASAVVAVPPTA